MCLQGLDVCLSYDMWELMVYDKKREVFSVCLFDFDELQKFGYFFFDFSFYFLSCCFFLLINRVDICS